MKLAALGFVIVAAACGGNGEGGGMPGLDGMEGRTCGSILEPPCGTGERCDFEANHCGGGEPGECRERPEFCPALLVPELTCGCDGVVYSSECDAHLAGTDLDASGACSVPSNLFACGFRQCTRATQYCAVIQLSGSDRQDFACRPLPPTCTGPLASCACVTAADPCAVECAGSAASGITIQCSPLTPG